MVVAETIEDEGKRYRTSFSQRILLRLVREVPVPEERAVPKSFWSNPVSWLLFSNAFRVVRASISRQLEIQDIATLDPKDASANRSREIRNYFSYYKEQNSNMPLVRALEKCYRREILISGLCAAVGDLGMIFHSILFMPFITYLEHRNNGDSGWQYTFGAGVGIIALSLLILMLVGLARTHKIYQTTFATASMKTSLDALLLEKFFHMSPLARKNSKDYKQVSEWSMGEIYNIMNTDTERVFNAGKQVHTIWTSFLSGPIGLGLAYWFIGWYGLAGIGTMIVFYPLLWYGGKFLSTLRKRANVFADRRNGIIGDTVGNIRFLKCFLWEDHFCHEAARTRKDENKQNSWLAAWQVVTIAISSLSSRIPSFVGVLLLSIYSTLSASRVVAFIRLTNDITGVSFYFGPALNEGINAYQSIMRIQAFLVSEDQKDERIYNPDQEQGVILTQAQLTWNRKEEETVVEEKENDDFKLAPVDLSVGPAELIAVVGPSGCGKSSLVAGICGDMPCVGGEITLKSSVAYCPQRPWIQNATVKENVLFGVPYEKEKYDGIINDCALAPDIKELVNQDETQLGELGINISGGQKQRVQLARTLYMNRDIVVMDDPLAAVDARTSRHLFENVICGRLKDKCRILVTHQLQILNRVDRIVFMENGKIVAFDTYDNLLNIESFNRFLSECRQHQEEEEKEEEEGKDKNVNETKVNAKVYTHIMTEERAVSSVPITTYIKFARWSSSVPVMILMYGVCILSQALNAVVTLSYAWWIDNRWNMSNMGNMGLVLGIWVGQWVLFVIFLLYVLIACLNGSRVLSMLALKRIVNAPISFFDRTPLGRIINRFTIDINQLDSELPFAIWQFLLQGTALVSGVGLTVSYVPVVSALVIPWVVVSILIIYMYKASPREIKRLESLSSSRLSARLSEGRSGKDSIRSAGQDELFLEQLFKEMDILNSIRREFYGAVQWAAMRQNLCSGIFYFCVGILGLSMGSKIAPAVFASLMSFCCFFPTSLGMITENVTQVQRNMVSVERLQHYATNIESEGIKRVENFKRDEKDWPLEGSIKFDGVDMRYDDNLPLSLKNMNLDIRGGSKVGVVGRTGAGKSSLFQVLLRMVKISKGSICIDGIDITTQMGLHDLRECIAVIPQDPTLFEGTVRSNLDPMGKKDDYELNAALKSASLLNEENNFSLEYKIAAGGDNLSNGQRQLMALARALVKDSKIIMIDEATSSVDFETDAKVQSVMMGLESKTVLSIAHRIRTVLHYDYICVMHNGEIVEYDTPLRLFDKPGSIFRSMCEESKLSREDLF